MKNNRTHQGRGVSLPDKMSAAVDVRLMELKPWVSSFSSYVQRLIYLDLTRKVINDDGGVNEDAVKPLKKGLADSNDIGAVSMSLGHSPAILMTHYRELVTTESALAFWNIRP